MNKTLTSLAVAAVALFGAQAAMAQSPTRAEVKKETAEANKAGQIADTGAGNVPGAAAGETSPKAKAATSDTTRDARKSSTAAANKAGAIADTSGGGAMTEAGDKAVKDAKSGSRAEVKKETAAANKAGQIPQTEAQMQQPKK
ncbi:MAG: DUF4148 domain-containing protein [Proteobacteria bacterium]|nr:DUF4148 domain-containing protein [Pseudomonadota bacterium]